LSPSLGEPVARPAHPAGDVYWVDWCDDSGFAFTGHWMSSTQNRRWLWLIPGGLLVVALLVCFAAWQYFKTTPAYALALLVDAAQQSDRAAFEQVVDLD